MQKVSYAFNQIQTCPMCKRPFDTSSDRRYPRLMDCGHSVCSQCVKNEVVQRKSLKCPLCHTNFTKDQCIRFKLNQVFIHMIQSLEARFGKSFFISQPLPHQLNQHQRRDQVDSLRERDAFCEEVKCKNPGCLKKTELIFCSAECQAHYDEVETMKNEGGFGNRRLSD